jgi:hypothetical protein
MLVDSIRDFTSVSLLRIEKKRRALNPDQTYKAFDLLGWKKRDDYVYGCFAI